MRAQRLAGSSGFTDRQQNQSRNAETLEGWSSSPTMPHTPLRGKYQHAEYERGPRCEYRPHHQHHGKHANSLPLTCPQLLTFKRETKLPLINNPDQLTCSESLIVWSSPTSRSAAWQDASFPSTTPHSGRLRHMLMMSRSHRWRCAA